MPGLYEFPRREHLTRRVEYLAACREGNKWVGRAFVCFIARREGQGRKFGFAVSRKVGKAVVRNRVKRYLREVYRTHRPRLADDIHVVVIARPEAAKLDYHQCSDAIRRLFRDGGVLSD